MTTPIILWRLATTLPSIAILFILVAVFAATNAEAALVRGSIEVVVEGEGRVTGSTVNCPPSCEAAAIWQDTGVPPTITLSTCAATRDIGGQQHMCCW